MDDIFFGLIASGSGGISEPNGGAPTGPSPIGWWKFNEGSGTSAADDSGNGNTGTLTGATWTTGPNSNAAVAMDGTGDYVAIANESNFDFERTQAFSISMWIRWNGSMTGGGHGIISKQSQTGNSPGIQCDLDADNSRVRFYLIGSAGDTSQANTAGSTVSANTWYHLVITYSGSSDGAGITIYLNGSSSTTGFGTTSNSILNDNPLWIGRGVSGYFWGDIDDTRFYSIELTSSEVLSIYTAGAQ